MSKPKEDSGILANKFYSIEETQRYVNFKSRMPMRERGQWSSKDQWLKAVRMQVGREYTFICATKKLSLNIAKFCEIVRVIADNAHSVSGKFDVSYDVILEQLTYKSTKLSKRKQVQVAFRILQYLGCAHLVSKPVINNSKQSRCAVYRLFPRFHKRTYQGKRIKIRWRETFSTKKKVIEYINNDIDCFFSTFNEVDINLLKKSQEENKIERMNRFRDEKKENREKLFNNPLRSYGDSVHRIMLFPARFPTWFVTSCFFYKKQLNRIIILGWSLADLQQAILLFPSHQKYFELPPVNPGKYLNYVITQAMKLPDLPAKYVKKIAEEKHYNNIIKVNKREISIGVQEGMLFEDIMQQVNVDYRIDSLHYPEEYALLYQYYQELRQEKALKQQEETLNSDNAVIHPRISLRELYTNIKEAKASSTEIVLSN